MAIAQERQQAETSTERSPIHVRKLGHIVYRVSDVERSIRFYTEVLNCRLSEPYRGRMAMLNVVGDHHSIGLMPATVQDPPNPQAMGLDHFAFEVATLDELFAARAFLRSRGIPIVFEGLHLLGGHSSIEFLDPDGYKVELYWHMDQIGPDNRTRPAVAARRPTLEAVRDNPLPVSW